MRIAFFGTGLMGSGFVRRLRASGHEVHVWNRSPAKARALESAGARAFDEPAAALDGVQRIHLSLSDDASVDAVLEPLAAVLPEGAWIGRACGRRAGQPFHGSDCQRALRRPEPGGAASAHI